LNIIISKLHFHTFPLVLSSNIDTSKFEYKRIFAHQRPDLGENVYFIQLATRYEIEKNLNTGTSIKVNYNDTKK